MQEKDEKEKEKERKEERKKERKEREREREREKGAKPAGSGGSLDQPSKAIRKWAPFVSTVEMKLGMTGSDELLQVSKVTFWIRTCEVEACVCCHQIPSHVH